MFRRLAQVAVILGASASCTTPTIDLSDPGKVSGYLMVFWDGEDNFIYYPYYLDPLVFELPRELADRVGAKTIRPGAIYTDGGSIPRSVRGWAGLSPWGYGPAYVVHDWLFVAHHCIVNGGTERHDPRDAKEVEKVKRVDFKTSADMLAAVIQALVDQNKVPKRDAAPKAIYSAVDSGIARSLWDSRDPKSCDPPDQKVLKEIATKLDRGARLAAVPDRPGGPVLVYQQRF